MDIIRFPARIRQFINAQCFEAEVDLYLGVYVRKRITIANSKPDMSLSRDYLNSVYRGSIVYLVVDNVGKKESDLELPVLVRSDCRGWMPFCPVAGLRRRIE